ncbi:hypothetical protein XENOCAPTIV_030942, partial [Xenoophorus captivus]
ETNTKIDLPAENSNSEMILITGKKANCEAAKNRILAIQKELVKTHHSLSLLDNLMWSKTSQFNCSLSDNIVEDNMIVDPKHHRYFVARRGQVLRDLADEYGGVMVSFPRTGSQSDKVTLKGAKECVEAAKKRMQEIVEDLALVPVTIEVEVPFELHRYIIGQKGSGIRKMMDEFEVNIQVPPPDQQSDKIAITGLASHLERAKEGLLERVKELQAEQEDRNAIAARDAIQGIVDELEEMISEEITLDSRVHARIIGARGKGIRKIMDEFKASSKCPPV